MFADPLFLTSLDVLTKPRIVPPSSQHLLIHPRVDRVDLQRWPPNKPGTDRQLPSLNVTSLILAWDYLFVILPLVGGYQHHFCAVKPDTRQQLSTRIPRSGFTVSGERFSCLLFHCFISAQPKAQNFETRDCGLAPTTNTDSSLHVGLLGCSYISRLFGPKLLLQYTRFPKVFTRLD